LGHLTRKNRPWNDL